MVLVCQSCGAIGNRASDFNSSGYACLRWVSKRLPMRTLPEGYMYLGGPDELSGAKHVKAEDMDPLVNYVLVTVRCEGTIVKASNKTEFEEALDGLD